MAQYWFVLAYVDSLEGEQLEDPWPEYQAREMDCTCEEAVRHVLGEFIDSYLEGQDVNTMDWETWRMWAFDHEPDRSEFATTGFDDACAWVEWKTPGMDEDPDIR